MKTKWKGISYFIMVLVVFIQIIPFYIAFTVSLKPKIDLTSRWIMPKTLYFDNYITAIKVGKILNAMKNSVIVTLIAVIFVCLIGAFAAYPLARVKTKRNQIIMLIILGVMMVPPLSVLVPLLTMMNKIGGVNSYWGIILLMITGQLPLSIFLYSSFIKTIPVDLEEAALIEGCNYIQIFYKIILPLLKPITSSVIILSGTFIWNDYQLSLYILQDPNKKTVTTTIASFFSQQSSNLGAASAASLIAIIPIVAVYLFLQKYFVKGMIDSAIK